MGTLQYDAGANYSGNTGTVSFFNTATTLTSTISDGEGDTTFETSDTLSTFVPPASTFPSTYAGNIEVALTAGGTMTLPVIVFSTVSFSLIPIPQGMSLSDFSFPTSIDLTALDPTPFPVCFLEGSQIATLEGEISVEHLSLGDEVQTAEGHPVKVKWIGRQTISTRFGPAERLMPVRFAAGSLGDGLPHTDLTVTADHGMLVDGVICHAGALVNGITITRVPLSEMGESYTVYHVETEDHEIILANGAPAETFIDNVSRRVFDNFAEFEALYGDVPEMEELAYPRAMSARQVPGPIHARLATATAA